MSASVGLCDSWCNDEQGNVGGFFVVGVLGPHAVIAEVPAMVAPEYDDGVGGELKTIEFVDDASDLGIDETDGGVIAVNQRASLIVVERTNVRDITVIADFAPGGRSVRRRALRRFAQSGAFERKKQRTATPTFFSLA